MCLDKYGSNIIERAIEYSGPDFNEKLWELILKDLKDKYDIINKPYIVRNEWKQLWKLCNVKNVRSLWLQNEVKSTVVFKQQCTTFIERKQS